MDGQKLFQNCLQLVEMKCIRSIGFRLRWIVVNLQEDAVDPCRYSSAGKDRNELRLPAADAIGGRGRLNRVSAVEDDRGEARA